MGARLVIAGTHSGVGKTTLTAGVIAALRRRGLVVQPFKVGPDYIDPTYHTLASGRPCRNLDAWMLPPEYVRSLFRRAAADADAAVIEGVMGLFDGAGYDDESGSTAATAKLLRAPVVLVLDASKAARSAAAVALGFLAFDPDLSLAGFIVNRAAGESHGRGVSRAVMEATGLPVFGWFPRQEALAVPERHLGLVPTTEPGRWDEFIRAAANAAECRLDMDRLLAVARQAPPVSETAAADRRLWPPENRPVVAVARDEAFQFTYEDNIDLLRQAGAQVVFFSPLRDEALPDRTAGVVLSGGFPEVYADGLAANRAMQGALRSAHAKGLPIYAECGGLMYLTESIVDGAGREHAMVGLLPGRSVMRDRPTLGYRLARAAPGAWLLPPGETIRGHEFHYSAWEGRPAGLPPAYYLLPRSEEGETRPEGACLESLWASYVHIHFAARPGLAGRYVTACESHAKCGARNAG